MVNIQKSVGKNGNNEKYDVMTIQFLLNKFIVAGCLPGTPPVVADGICGAHTIAAIKAFQKYAGMGSPDGLINPGGKTLIELNAAPKFFKPTPSGEGGFVRPETLHDKSKAARLYGFSVGSSELKPEHKLYLSTLRPLIRPSEGRFVIIHGLTSKTGSQGKNLELSAHRMLAVRNYLISIGVPPEGMFGSFSGEAATIGTIDEDPLDRAVVVAVTTSPPPPPPVTPKYSPILPDWDVPVPDDPIVFPDDDPTKYAIRMVAAVEPPRPPGLGGSIAMATFEIRNYRAYPTYAIYQFAGLRVSQRAGGSLFFRGSGPWNVFRFPEELAIDNFGGHVWYSTASFGFLNETSSAGVLKILPWDSDATVTIKGVTLGWAASVGASIQLVTGALTVESPPMEFKE